MLNKLKSEKVIAVLRADSIEETMNYVDAIYAGGIKALELTYSIPNVCEAIRQVKNKYPDSLIGIGSVLTSAQAKAAIDAGASYVVSPGFTAEVQACCDRLKIPYMPGVMTVSEIINSMNHKNAVAKVFPGEILGINFIKDIKVPIPNACLMVTGGVDIKNIDNWFESGVEIVGIGSSLTKPGLSGDFQKVTSLAKEFKTKVEKW